MSQAEHNKMASDSIAAGNKLSFAARILIVDDNSELSQFIAGLVEKELGEGLSMQATNAEQALKTLGEYKIECAVVRLSSVKPQPLNLADKIQLCNPAIPVLAIGIGNNSVINPSTAERIAAGIRYVKSLTRCGLKGFTIVVKE